MTQVDYEHPFERHQLLWRTWPFLGVMLLAWALLPWVGVVDRPALVVAAALLNLLLAIAVWALPWRRLGVASVVAPLAWLVVVVLLRHGTDGANAGYSPLVLLSILWAAIYGSRWMLWLCTAAVFAVLVVPTFLGSEVMYPETEVRRAVLYCVLGILVGEAIQATIASLRAEREGRVRAEAKLTRRRAFELNDDVVQDLAVAKLALDARRETDARAAVERALAAGKRIITDMVEETGSFERAHRSGEDPDETAT